MKYCDRKDLLEAIVDHLRANGARNWSVLRLRFGSVSDATFWRRVREAKEQIAAQQLTVTVRGARTAMEPHHRATGPGPIHLLASGGPPHVDYPGTFQSMYDGVEKLYAYALNADGDIRFPAVFERALKMREKLVAKTVYWTESIYSAKASQAFYESLLAEISLEVPDIRKRVIDRLYIFGKSQGVDVDSAFDS